MRTHGALAVGGEQGQDLVLVDRHRRRTGRVAAQSGDRLGDAQRMGSADRRARLRGDAVEQRPGNRERARTQAVDLVGMLGEGERHQLVELGGVDRGHRHGEHEVVAAELARAQAPLAGAARAIGAR